MRLGGDPEAQYRLGVAYRGLGLAANAELAFERALALRPRYGMALVELGWVRLNRGDRAGAEAAWTRAAGLGGRAAEEARTSMAATLTRDAIAAQEAGNTAEERRLWGRVLEWDPENRAARHHLR
jgi:tetratricopeptide (TPR) repeat protein